MLQGDDLQNNTDDVPQSDTVHNDIPVVTVPHNNDQTSVGVNQSTNAPTVSYITGIMLCAASYINELIVFDYFRSTMLSLRGYLKLQVPTFLKMIHLNNMPWLFEFI